MTVQGRCALAGAGVLFGLGFLVVGCSDPAGAGARLPKATQCVRARAMPLPADTTTGASPQHPHEPSGFTRVTDLLFSDTNAVSADGWAIDGGPYFSIAADSMAPDSTLGVGQALFPAGLPGNASPIGLDKNFGYLCLTHLYISFWVKISDNWQSHTVGNKIGYAWTHNEPTAYALFVPGSADSVYGSLHSQMRLQSTPDGRRGEQDLPVDANDVPIVRGKWQHWEILLISNTGSQWNGSIEWWIDGDLAGIYQHRRFSAAGQGHFWQRVSWRPVWGGGPPQTVRRNQYMWLDQYYVSGSR